MPGGYLINLVPEISKTWIINNIWNKNIIKSIFLNVPKRLDNSSLSDWCRRYGKSHLPSPPFAPNLALSVGLGWIRVLVLDFEGYLVSKDRVYLQRGAESSDMSSSYWRRWKAGLPRASRLSESKLRDLYKLCWGAYCGNIRKLLDFRRAVLEHSVARKLNMLVTMWVDRNVDRV